MIKSQEGRNLFHKNMDIRHLTGRIDPLLPSGGKEISKGSAEKNSGERFVDVLERIAGSKLNFSGHATDRLKSRNIDLDESDVARLEEAVERAAKKGSNDSLVMDGDNVYVVNVPNRTVITAMDQLEMRERVFTKIDSAVFTKPSLASV
jgi:flagellar operon protein